LPGYAEARTEPSLDAAPAAMSPYLHFAIGANQIARAAPAKADAPASDKGRGF